jgi:hypothetical protein
LPPSCCPSPSSSCRVVVSPVALSCRVMCTVKITNAMC